MSLAKFMEGRAVDLRTGGRYSLASRRDLQGNRREFACRTTRISPFQMLVAAPVVGPIGERVITFFGELGKLDGWISDVVENGFLVDIALTKKVRERLAKKLVWLEKKQKEAVVDVRGQQRVAPENPHTNLIFGDGTTVSCFVIDVSPSGAAVSADIDTEIGTRLSVGRSVGHVVRRFDEGFAVQFDRLHDPSCLETMIRPPSDIYVYRSPLEIPPQRIYLDTVRKSGEVSREGVVVLPQQEMWLVD
jgi:hypothetical protein